MALGLSLMLMPPGLLYLALVRLISPRYFSEINRLKPVRLELWRLLGCVLILAMEYSLLRFREHPWPGSLPSLAVLGDSVYIPVMLSVGSSRRLTVSRDLIVLSTAALAIASTLAVCVGINAQ